MARRPKPGDSRTEAETGDKASTTDDESFRQALLKELSNQPRKSALVRNLVVLYLMYELLCWGVNHIAKPFENQAKATAGYVAPRRYVLPSEDSAVSQAQAAVESKESPIQANPPAPLPPQNQETVKLIKQMSETEVATAAKFKVDCDATLDANTNKIMGRATDSRQALFIDNDQLRAQIEEITKSSADYVAQINQRIELLTANPSVNAQPLLDGLPSQLGKLDERRKQIKALVAQFDATLAAAPQKHWYN